MSGHFPRAIFALRCALAALVVFGLSQHPVTAQTSPERYSLVLRGAPLDNALEALVARTRIDLAYDPPLVRGKQVTCAAENVSAEDLLRCVLRGTGLDFYRLSSGLYVLTPEAETVPLYGRLRGIVVDAETRQPLPNAHVMLADLANGTAANDAGMFTFPRLKPGSYIVLATYVGYETGTAAVEVPAGGDAQAEIALQSEPMVVQPIVIDGMQWRLPSADLGSESLQQENLLRNPSSGASDVLVGLNSLLGVRVSDATADIHVQGGETGEHQLRLDGAPVFLPLNFASFVGPFSPFAIGSITVHKAGFSAAEGSQISGVIDIRQDLNISEPMRIDVQADPLSANARLSMSRGRSGGVQTVLTAAGRVGLWNLYSPRSLQSHLAEWNTTDPFFFTLFDRADDLPRFEVREDSTTGNPGIGFADIHLATRVRFGLLKSLHTSAYIGQSKLGSDLADAAPSVDATSGLADMAAEGEPFRDQFTWDTGMAQSHFEAVLSGRAMARVGIRGSFYRVRHDYSVPDSSRGTGLGPNGEELSAIDDGNRVYEMAAEGRLDYVLSRRHSLTSGVELIQSGTRFAVLGTQKDPILHESSSWRAAAYLQDEVSFNERFTADVGTRLSYLPTHDQFFFEPRISIRYDHPGGLFGRWSARASTGRYRQFINQFDVSNRSPRALLSSTRFWLATVDPELEPSSATHYSAEFIWNPTRQWTMRLEGYFKNQDNILAIDYSTLPSGNATMEQREFMIESEGTVRGAGIQVQRSLGPGRAEIRYEYNVANRRIEGMYECRSNTTCAPLPAPWNEPHRLEFGLDLLPFQGITLLARWKGVWGRTWGFRQGYYDYLGAFASLADDLHTDLVRFAQRHLDRYQIDHPDEHGLPPIYQLDLSGAYTHPFSNGSTLQLRVDVLNVLNRDNVSEWHLVYNEETYHQLNLEGGYLEKEERPLLPRLISVAVKWTLK